MQTPQPPAHPRAVNHLAAREDAPVLNGFETLAAQPAGRACLLHGLTAAGRLAQRLADMGFLPGLAVRVVRRAPLGDPLEVDLAGVRVCIRAEEAGQVLVRPLDGAGVRP